MNLPQKYQITSKLLYIYNTFSIAYLFYIFSNEYIISEALFMAKCSIFQVLWATEGQLSGYEGKK